MRPTYNVDEQNFYELIVGFIGETLREKRLVGKILMNGPYS